MARIKAAILSGWAGKIKTGVMEVAAITGE